MALAGVELETLVFRARLETLVFQAKLVALEAL